MKKLIISILVALILVSVLAGGCAKQAPSPAPTPEAAPPKTLDIGVAAPLTGPTAFLGTTMQNAILLAIDDQNKGILLAGGQSNEGGVTIAGQKYMLNGIARDTKLDVVVSKNIAEELIFDRGVKVIAGPFIGDAIGTQYVTEPNKVILFGCVAIIPTMTGPTKPYTFFCGWPVEQMYTNILAYMQEFYPEAKKIVSMTPDLPDAPLWMDAAKAMCPEYCLEWLGVDKFPFDTKDFMPVITRALAKNPDIIDTGTSGGSMAQACALLIKQLGEVGFKGVIMIPTSTQREIMEEVVPAKYLNRVVIDWIPNKPVGSKAYCDFSDRFQEKFGVIPNSMAGFYYNSLKAFFEFLDGQDSTDTTAWVEGFEKYHWQGIWGTESFWVGKPLSGIDRRVLGPSWIGEWVDGKLIEEKWTAPLPYDIFVGK